MSIRLIIIGLISLSGCSLFEFGQRRPEEDLTPVRKVSQVDSSVQLTLNLKEYRSLLEVDGAVNRARLIPIFSRETGTNTIEQYRIFDIQSNSLYEYIGLKNLDEIVAINGFYLPGSTAFFKYLTYMSQYRGGQIEIRRQGRPLLLKYKIR